MSGRYILILILAVGSTVYQLYRLRKLDSGVNGVLPVPLEGLTGFQAVSDWGLLRGAIHTRLSLHAPVLQSLDGRDGAGHGFRQLALVARPGAVAAAFGSGSSALASLWPAGSAWTSPLLLLTMHESASNDGLAGLKPQGTAQFFGSRGSSSLGGASAPVPAALARPIPRRRGMFDAIFGGVREGVDSGPARGKAARAFGAHSRGPSLLSRSASSAAPVLTLQLLVHIPGLTCSLPHTQSTDITQNTSAAAATAGAETDAATEAGAVPPLPAQPAQPAQPTLPPCTPTQPHLPYLQPSSPQSASALAAALRTGQGSGRETASASLTAPYLSWPEAVLALVLDLHRLRVALVLGPTGAAVANLTELALTLNLHPAAGSAAGSAAVAAVEEKEEGAPQPAAATATPTPPATPSATPAAASADSLCGGLEGAAAALAPEACAGAEGLMGGSAPPPQQEL